MQRVILLMTNTIQSTIRHLLELSEPLPGQPPGLWPYAIPALGESWLAPLIRRIGATWSVKWVGLDHLRTTAASSSWILASWHEALLMNMYALRDTELVAVVSPSWEGEIISRTMSGLGLDLTRASSGHQPMHAIRESVRQLKAGRTIGWVVDGPVGPRREVKPGIIQIASLAQKPILPMQAIAMKHWNLPSWDRQIIPVPATHLVIGFGEPIFVPKGARGDTLTEYVSILSTRLDKLEQHLKQESAIL
jgi:lysophospholipid acyltransferase (LPLAT)-like uncharacterized protein